MRSIVLLCLVSDGSLVCLVSDGSLVCLVSDGSLVCLVSDGSLTYVLFLTGLLFPISDWSILSYF